MEKTYIVVNKKEELMSYIQNSLTEMESDIPNIIES